MNLLLIALAAFLLLGQKQPEKKNKNIFSEMSDFGILGDGAKNLMDSFSRLSNESDKTAAIMELISNPIVFNMFKNILFKEKPENPESPPSEKAGESENAGGNAHKDAPADEKAEDKKLMEIINEAKQEAAGQTAAAQPSGGASQAAGEETPEAFSDEARDFFRPVEKVAGIEVSKELYRLYDGWYLEN